MNMQPAPHSIQGTEGPNCMKIVRSVLSTKPNYIVECVKWYPTINHSVIEHTTYSNLLNVALLCILKL